MRRVTLTQEQSIQLRLSGLKPGWIVNKATATRANQHPEGLKELIVCFLGGPNLHIPRPPPFRNR